MNTIDIAQGRHSDPRQRYSSPFSLPIPVQLSRAQHLVGRGWTWGCVSATVKCVHTQIVAQSEGPLLSFAER